MIILDTNILRGISLRGVSADLLKTIRAAGVEQVAVPWTVMEELAAQQAVRYQGKYDEAHAALEALRKVTPWGVAKQSMPPYQVERVREHWRDLYSALVDVVPVSADVMQEAIFREANLLAPCKVVSVKGQDKQVKVGARDASIWLTAVEYAREHPEETVYFVSQNTNDFGDGSTYEQPMGADLQGLDGRFVHYTSLDDVVKEFTEPTDVDEEAVRAILSTPENGAVVVEEAWRGFAYRPAPGLIFDSSFACSARAVVDSVGGTVSDGQALALGWLMHPKATLDGVWDLSAYRIGDHVWCTATARWLLTGSALVAQPFTINGVMAAWETRVLVSLTNSEAALTVLRSALPTGVTQEEFAAMPEVPFWGKNMPAVPRRPGATPMEGFVQTMLSLGLAWQANKGPAEE
ncbi:PIN domain-containing protein [Streptomyces sp. KAU_LT]|uniref:PIN domain-containing protein n=1 Tax=Streptomyces sp. KAU_LT TaxID=3046669 RepID=UPI0024B6BF30|nr:PIN domain-containing protein [Streptomyces sp. KAU_LT]MDI9829705.1 PIN domain-containing protein [Streptomyces sp. KAU_LT]